MHSHSVLFNLIIVLLSCPMVHAQGNTQKMPKEDVIDIPAMDAGLCVSNAFQTNRVLQRDKPVRIWGWAAPSERVTVSFAGQTQTVMADGHRAWKVTFTAMGANATPQTLTVQGRDKTLTLENVLVGDVWLLGGQSNSASLR